jgi:hypothetical protein
MHTITHCLKLSLYLLVCTRCPTWATNLTTLTVHQEAFCVVTPCNIMGYHRFGRMYCLQLPNDTVTSQPTLECLGQGNGSTVLVECIECSQSEGPTYIIDPLHCPNHFGVYLSTTPSSWRWRQHVPPKRRCQNPSNYHLINNCRVRLKTCAELYILH